MLNFYEQFINHNFESYVNDSLKKSYDYYILPLQKYLKESKINEQKYKELNSQLETNRADCSFKGLTNSDHSTIVYFCTTKDQTDKINNIKQQIRNIIIAQKQLFTNFVLYLQNNSASLNKQFKVGPKEPNNKLKRNKQWN